MPRKPKAAGDTPAPKRARKAAPKTAKPKAAKSPKATKRPRKRSPSVVSRARPPVSWRRWLLVESAVIGAGVAVGLGVAGGFLWSRARSDVAAYVADPPRSAPAVIWSAPMEIRAGQRGSIAALAGDLIAAGYDRVDRVGQPAGHRGAGVFSVSGDRIEVWTEPLRTPGFQVSGGAASLRIVDGLVVSTSEPRLTLRPTVLGAVGDLADRRAPVELSKLSKWVEPALLAIEDSRFRDHHGVDPVGLTRALVRNALGGGHVQGGSTLTQQLAKNLFLSADRTMRRKVREVFFAAALEAELGKDALLELYLGEVYLGQMGGQPLYGVDAAARAWFGKSAGRLDVHEAAAIVGVIAAPNRYSPVRHPEQAVARRDRVLDRMVVTGALSAEQAEAAKARPLVLSGLPPSRVRRAPYAVDLAVDRAEEALGPGALSSGGYQVWTTIQPLLQRAAEEAVADGMAELDAEYPKAAGAQVALVAVRVEDGAVVAMVGGRSYATSPFNRAAGAWRQAGSTVKPLTLLAALDSGAVTPADRLDDSPISRRVDGAVWTPTNYDGRFVGEITVRKAIEGSRNIPAVLLAEKVGASQLQRFNRKAGLSKASHLPSASLGAFAVTPLQMAGAYTAFPGGGAVREPRLLDAITTSGGDDVLRFAPKTTQLARARAAAQATAVLQGVIADGTGARASRYGVTGPAGGKTGTTDAYRDAWFVGFTPELAVAVWVGRDSGTLGLSGSRAALPTWARFVAGSGTLDGSFGAPEGLVTVELCAETGHVARPACDATYEELFVDGSTPKGKCTLHGAPTVEAARVLGGLFRKRRGADDADD